MKKIIKETGTIEIKLPVVMQITKNDYIINTDGTMNKTSTPIPLINIYNNKEGMFSITNKNKLDEFFNYNLGEEDDNDYFNWCFDKKEDYYSFNSEDDSYDYDYDDFNEIFKNEFKYLKTKRIN
jgi:hypothetical protein